MGKSLSLDIRERVVVALVDEGLSCHEAARRLRISAASAVRIMQRMKRTGGVRRGAARAGRDVANWMLSLDWLRSRVSRRRTRHHDARAGARR